MCGIAGVFGSTARMRPDGPGRESRTVLAHRGPDSFGSWHENGVSFFHWRLAIIDLSPAGNQPMLSANGRFVLCYNGEVYNFQELRTEIDRRHAAVHWRGRSDTEVILEG